MTTAEKSQKIKDDILKVLDEHKISDVVMIFRQPIKGREIRVIAGTERADNQECQSATLIEDGLKISPQFRGIFEHITKHSIGRMIGDMRLHEKGKKVD